ncbi:hypothetical protein FRB97_001462 [Tulasnella sp. 331]|nr:hypothetical protein FRB97_001462 [Tulasnella sp. 331]
MPSSKRSVAPFTDFLHQLLQLFPYIERLLFFACDTGVGLVAFTRSSVPPIRPLSTLLLRFHSIHVPRPQFSPLISIGFNQGTGDLDSLRKNGLPTSIRSRYSYSKSDDSSSIAVSTRTHSSDEHTLADDASTFSFPSRTKLWAWGPEKKGKSDVMCLAPPAVLKNTPGSDTEFEDDESEDDEDLIMRPPDTWELPKSFQAPELGLRNGSRQLRCGPWEVPYPISYDKVLMDTDGQTHELVKALIPTRNCLSFYEFAKPPSAVLDIGCGAGRWVVEAAGSWKDTRFVGLDLMAIQFDLSGRFFDDIRDRVQWVHTNFLHYQIPFAGSTFDYIRMSHIALAIPTEHWKHVIYEIRRVLKPGGVLEWIDEDPVLPLSPNCVGKGSERLERAASLEVEFKSLIRSRKLHKPATTVKKLLKGRALRMRTTQTTKIRLGLPTCDIGLLHRNSESFASVRIHHQGKPSTDFFSDDESMKFVPRGKSHFTPPGLVVLPERKFIPLALPDITTQATRNFQLVLGAAEAIWLRRLFYDPDADRAEFEQEIWEYERGGCSRLHLPAPTWDNETPIAPAHPQQPSLSTLNHRRRAPLSLPYLPPSAASNKPTIVTIGPSRS